MKIMKRRKITIKNKYASNNCHEIMIDQASMLDLKIFLRKLDELKNKDELIRQFNFYLESLKKLFVIYKDRCNYIYSYILAIMDEEFNIGFSVLSDVNYNNDEDYKKEDENKIIKDDIEFNFTSEGYLSEEASIMVTSNYLSSSNKIEEEIIFNINGEELLEKIKAYLSDCVDASEILLVEDTDFEDDEDEENEEDK